MRRVFITTLVLLAITYFPATTEASLLGDASGYNVFVFGDMNVHGSDTQGRIAAGGNFTASNYSIGLMANPAQYSLVSGGKIDYRIGAILNGGIFAQDDVYLKNYGVYGDVDANGTISYGSGGTITGTATANANLTSPIDFTSTKNNLTNLSINLSSKSANGSTTVFKWGGISLQGNGQQNYFNLNGDALNRACSLTLNIGADDKAIVNVSGKTLDFGAMGWNITNGNVNNILFNFYEADTLSISNVGISGSILAPHAAMSFNSGQITGTVIAASIEGTGQYNQPIPEPATLFMLSTGLAGLACTKRRKNGNYVRKN